MKTPNDPFVGDRFKRGKMYRYEGTSWKQTTFVDFLDHGYEKVKAELVPPEPSALYVERIFHL